MNDSSMYMLHFYITFLTLSFCNKIFTLATQRQIYALFMQFDIFRSCTSLSAHHLWISPINNRTIKISNSPQKHVKKAA